MNSLMFWMRAPALAVAAAFTFSGALSAPAAAAPLEVYGRMPLIEQAEISPDGSMIAYIITSGEKRMLSIRETADGKVVSTLDTGNAKVRDISWAGSQYIIVRTSQTTTVDGLYMDSQQEWATATVVEVRGKRVFNLLGHVKGGINSALSQPIITTINGDLVATVQAYNFVDSRARLGLYRVKLKNGHADLLEPGFADTMDWALDGAGNPVAQETYTQQTGAWRLRLRDGFKWTEDAAATALIDPPSLSGIGRDSQSVLVVTSDDEHEMLLKEYRVGAEPVVIHDEIFSGLIRDPRTRHLIGISTIEGDEGKIHFFDPKDAAAWTSVVKSFPGDKIELKSWSDDRRKVIVLVDSVKEGAAYALVDLDKKSASWLGQYYGDLTEADIAEKRAVSYKAKDGLPITGYLTLPHGKDPKNLPLVVLPHGGPEARDEPGFDWWSQALASRGYAVLQPNFRGSAGFGEKFVEAGYGEWGKKMQTDLSDGVRDLAGKGIIDPKRVCIVGASYGGYAALAGATMDPGVYKCAVSVAGVSDLRRMLYDDSGGAQTSDRHVLRYWTQFLGVEKRTDPRLDEVSPVTHAAKADAPILLIHGKDDTVVYYNQSTIMESALRKAGKPVELVTLKGEDHWLSTGATRLQMLKATVDFLEKHNPPN